MALSVLILILVIWLISPSRLFAQGVDVAYYGEDSAEFPTTGSLLYTVDDTPKLLVQLNTDGKVATAHVYQQPSNSNITFGVSEAGKITVSEEHEPTLILTAPDGWWVRDGVINYNLDIIIKGRVNAMWGAGGDEKYGGNGWVAALAEDDTRDTVHVTVRDANHTGIPQWDLRQLQPEFRGSGYYRVNYSERKCDTPITQEPSLSPQWPYISAESSNYEQASTRLKPPIIVNWQQGRITHFKELVSVRNQNCSYSLYSISPLREDQLNYPNFETPFAFYDLSGKGEGTPNLVLRTEYFPANDTWSRGLRTPGQRTQPVPEDWQRIRYSWRNTVGDLRWDYKIEVMGTHPYTTTTAIAGNQYQIAAPDYETFPTWVTEHKWPVTTFVDATQSGFQSTEGIYLWSPDMIGVGSLFNWSPLYLDRFNQIVSGFRGELYYGPPRKPALYFSPIDHQLHLSYASQGVWQINDNLALHTSNLNQDETIDLWSLILDRNLEDNVKGEAIQTLYQAGNYMFLTDPLSKTVQMKRVTQADIRPIIIPTDKTSWQEHQRQLAEKKPPNSDLSALFTDFRGDSMRLDGAEISEFRFTETGFRFRLTLHPSFMVGSTDSLNLKGLNSGWYNIELDERGFSVQPETAGQLSLNLNMATVDQTATTSVQQIQVVLWNDGVRDLYGTNLRVEALKGDLFKTLFEGQIDLFSAENTAQLINWTPPEEGNWTITAYLTDNNDKPLSQIERIFPSTITDFRQFERSLLRSGTATATFLIILIALLLSLIVSRFIFVNDKNRPSSK